MKQALLDAHVGKDISGSYEDSTCQPFFTIEAKNAREEDRKRFLTIIRETLEKLTQEGLDRKALASGINFFEFRFREADYATFPKGLIYGIELFVSWLYDDDRPFDYLKQLSVFEELKQRAEEGYFEGLIRKYLLENSHGADVVLRPRRGLAARKEAEEAEKLAAYKASLGREELEELVRQTKALKKYQESEETPEALACIPLLQRSDISRKTPVALRTEKADADGTDVLYHDYFTNGIGYLTLRFRWSRCPTT